MTAPIPPASGPAPSTPAAAGDAAGRAALPATWRLGVFILAATAGVLAMRAVWPMVGASLAASGITIPGFYVTMLGGLLVGHWWTFRTVEPRRWAAVGLGVGAWSPRVIGLGVLLGAAAVGLPSLVLLLGGWLRVESTAPGNWAGAAVGTLLVLLPAALWEELLTRGYLFTVVREWIGARRAIVATSAVFGALHLENAGVTWQSVALVTLAGIFLGSIRVATGSLAAAWAAHVAWNFVMAGLLHTSVSGVGMGTPNYRVVDAGPDWATGGTWGPEAGLLTAAGLLIAIYIMLRRGRRGVHHQ